MFLFKKAEKEKIISKERKKTEKDRINYFYQLCGAAQPPKSWSKYATFKACFMPNAA